MRPVVAALASAHGHVPAGRFTVAHHEHVRDLFELSFADLVVHLFTARVHVHA
jgi:hypothetical protein